MAEQMPFGTRDARRVCFNRKVVSNIAENARNRKRPKRGRRRLFDAEIYKDRFTNERSFAWTDKSLGFRHIALALINLRHILASKA